MAARSVNNGTVSNSLVKRLPQVLRQWHCTFAEQKFLGRYKANDFPPEPGFRRATDPEIGTITARRSYTLRVQMPDDHKFQTHDMQVDEGMLDQDPSILTRLPGEVRNRIYDFVVPEKDVYTLQYPRASGTSDLISSSIFGIQRQIRYEALTYHYPDSKVVVQPRPGFVLSYIPRCLNDLPCDVLKVAKEIEVHAELLPPFPWSGGPDGDLLRVSFTVSAEGLYATRANYRSKRENRARKTLYRTQTAELRMYVEEQTAIMENLMLTQLEGREMKKAANSRLICIEVNQERKDY